MPALSHDIIGRIDKAFEGALERGCFSGAALAISAGNGIVFSKTWGCDRTDGAAVEDSSEFDLASLTKPLATAPVVMAGVTLGVFGLNDSISRFFPSVPPEKRGITIRRILGHCSGLAPHRQFFTDLVRIAPQDRRDAIVSMILKEPLEATPGTVASYSDLGFILLGAILEKVFGDRLDQLARKLVYEPLDVDGLHFCPLGMMGGPDVTPQKGTECTGRQFVATEFCPWRKRLLVGEVSDENAWILGGVAGHAGLFGTARGVFDLVTRLKKIYRGDLTDPFRPRDLLRLFWSRTGVPKGGSWALGFDTPSIAHSAAGRYFSRNSIGHLGFTGASFWLDLDRDILVVLLTNRVHLGRENDKFKRFRPTVHDLIMEALSPRCG